MNIVHKNRSFFLAQILIFMTIVFLIGASLRRGWIYDETECLKSSWFISCGMEPYIDFFQHHHPLFYYILSPFALLTKETTFLFIGKIIALLFFLITLLYTYRLGRLLFDSFIGIISVFCCISWSMLAESGFEVRPDTPQIACATVGTYYLFFFLKNRSKKYLFLSAFYYSCSFLFLQKSFIFPIFVLIIFIVEWLQKRISFKDGLLWGAVYALPILGYWAFLIAKGSFYQYWLCNYLFNIEMAKNFTWNRFFKMFVNEVFLRNVILWFFLLIGCFNNKKSYLIILILCLTLSIIVMHIDGPHYWIIVVPYFSVVAAHALDILFGKNKCMLVFFCLFLVFPTFKVWLGNIKFGNQQQIKELAYFRSLSNVKDICFADNMIANFRKSPDFFWHGDFWGDKKIYQNCSFIAGQDCLSILKKRPRVVQKGKLQGGVEVVDFLNNHYDSILEYPDIYVLKDKFY